MSMNNLYDLRLKKGYWIEFLDWGHTLAFN